MTSSWYNMAPWRAISPLPVSRFVNMCIYIRNALCLLIVKPCDTGCCWLMLNCLKEAHFENVLLLKLIVWFRYCPSKVLHLKLVLKTCIGKNFCTMSNSSIVYIHFLKSIHSSLKFESVIVFCIYQKDIFKLSGIC